MARALALDDDASATRDKLIVKFECTSGSAGLLSSEVVNWQRTSLIGASGGEQCKGVQLRDRERERKFC